MQHVKATAIEQSSPKSVGLQTIRADLTTNYYYSKHISHNFEFKKTFFFARMYVGEQWMKCISVVVFFDSFHN